jgi:hypothetical protein
MAHVTIVKTSVIEPSRVRPLSLLRMPHRRIFIAMMMLRVEEPNGEDRHGHSKYGAHHKIEDGHWTLPGKHGKLPPPVSLCRQLIPTIRACQ